ncbi:NAD(P)-binding domain-containing protein [Achromobacter xylosoxidans]
MDLKAATASIVPGSSTVRSKHVQRVGTFPFRSGHRRWAGRIGGGLLAEAAGYSFSDRRGQRPDRRCLAATLRLAVAVHHARVQRLARHGPGGQGACRLYRDEFADYLEAYARRFALPIRLSTSVQRLRAGPQGSFLADLSDGGTLAATHVIVATGGFQAPVVPAIAHGFGAQIPQLTPESFGAGESLPDGPVLVVGDGASTATWPCRPRPRIR